MKTVRSERRKFRPKKFRMKDGALLIISMEPDAVWKAVLHTGRGDQRLAFFANSVKQLMIDIRGGIAREADLRVLRVTQKLLGSRYTNYGYMVLEDVDVKREIVRRVRGKFVVKVDPA
jgi:hypothetical protein